VQLKLGQRRPKTCDRHRWIVTKGRWLVFAALILATLATAWVGLSYDRGVDYGIQTGPPLVALTVFNVDVPAGTDLDQLIKEDQLRIMQVPPDAVGDGTVTSAAGAQAQYRGHPGRRADPDGRLKNEADR
jgi:hypothetical protein